MRALRSSSRLSRTILAVVMLAAGIGIGTGAMVVAEGDTTYTACVNNSSGTIKMIDEGGSCANNEEYIQWSSGAVDLAPIETELAALQAQVAVLEQKVAFYHDANFELPTLTIGDTTCIEGDPCVFTLTLSHAMPVEVTAAYQTMDIGSATSFGMFSDYTTTWGTAVFAPGTTSFVVEVPTYADTFAEVAEEFYFYVSNIVNATTASGDSDLGAIGEIVDP